MVICDWTVVLVGLLTDWSTSNSHMFRVIKLQRLFRLFRTIRLIGGISHVFDNLEFRIGGHSGMFGLVSQVVFIFSLFTWLNHLISCGMVAIGFYATADIGMSWMDTSLESGRASFAESTRSYQYWTAMHWSMAQASVPGLLAVNTWERVACVWLRLVDKIFNVALISALSVTMVGVTMTSKKSVELRKLGQFLRTSGVTRRTALRVRKAAIKRLSQTDVVGEEQIPVVGQLSTGQRRELRFDMLGQRRPHVRRRRRSQGGVLGALWPTQSFLQHPEVSFVEKFQEQDVEEDTWLCEAVLWTRWVHVGSCKSKCDSQVVLIQANLLADVVSRHRRGQCRRLPWKTRELPSQSFRDHGYRGARYGPGGCDWKHASSCKEGAGLQCCCDGTHTHEEEDAVLAILDVPGARGRARQVLCVFQRETRTSARRLCHGSQDPTHA